MYRTYTKCKRNRRRKYKRARARSHPLATWAIPHRALVSNSLLSQIQKTQNHSKRPQSNSPKVKMDWMYSSSTSAICTWKCETRWLRSRKRSFRGMETKINRGFTKCRWMYSRCGWTTTHLSGIFWVRPWCHGCGPSSESRPFVHLRRSSLLRQTHR